MSSPYIKKIIDWLDRHDFRLAHLLIKNFWFRLAFLGFLLTAIGVPLAVVRMIPVTPESVSPKVTISMVDWLQAKSLARSARNTPPDTDLAEVAHRWRMAIGNNQGDSENNRDYLRMLIQRDKRRDWWQDAIRTSFWLLRLNQTNAVDVELACQAFDAYDFHGYTQELVTRYDGERSIAIEKPLLRALFTERKFTTFLTEWGQAQAETRQDPELQLYQVTASVCSKGGDTATSGATSSLSALEAAKESPSLSALAHHLQLYVSHAQSDRTSFEDSFAHLVANFEDTLRDHLLYWQLLANLNDLETARNAVTQYAPNPRSARDVIDIANACSQLGLTELAFAYLTNYATAHGYQQANWHAQAELLLNEERWGDLGRFAIDLRAAHGVSSAFLGYSYFLEGKAAFERDRQWECEAYFDQIANFDLSESHLGLYVASHLSAMGYPKQAMDALWPERNYLRDDSVFWELLLKLAATLQDGSRIFLATENLYRLDPNSIRAAANYASILISQRIQLDEALALTYNAYVKNSNNPEIRINYGHALIINERYSEAEEVLAQVNPNKLTSNARQGFYFAAMELYYKTDRRDLAQKMSEEIIASLLLPGDRAIFENMVDQLRLQSEAAALETIAE